MTIDLINLIFSIDDRLNEPYKINKLDYRNGHEVGPHWEHYKVSVFMKYLDFYCLRMTNFKGVGARITYLGRKKIESN